MRRWVAASLVAGGAMAAQAAPDDSLRPAQRPEAASQEQQYDNYQLASAATDLRPAARPAVLKQAEPQPAAAELNFQGWIQGFRDRALAQGISAPVLDSAFAGVSYDPEVIRRDRNQSEFTKTIWEYLDSAASELRVKNGKAAVRENQARLDQIEAKYGVEKEIVVAVWGLESSYGTFRGKMDVIRSLATLAFDGRRGAFFEGQLVAALKILQAGDVAARKMTGSWAGAMGHTQFIPTSYLDYAVDFTGDGKRDIWSDNPADALASTAAYLKQFGWVKGQPWGVEVALPKGFDYTLADRDIEKLPSEWAALGIKGLDGRAVTDHGKASILLPAGSAGAAFMIFQNFSVLERYNTADAYVIGVGHLADRIKGGTPIQSSWPRSDRALTRAEREELQQRLSSAGFDTEGVDGRIGPKTIGAVRAYQVANGLTADGYASPRLLQRLR
ncbi:lytic murein transglycosylase [Leisingera aquaemixtae]|uniref:Membrane-bound lytic murein transglycosylase B n=1 Tax=Leisingera aquaemixtae TaxID=1396826 RepID=A0A0P1HYU6_9RHOB|nr:lytic murein transglycosylase [Leisingera aquaemixtae]CUI01507.1 Membrane-bound lytic murein transglycosylase B precursor [Leisingera aquaemixtae]